MESSRLEKDRKVEGNIIKDVKSLFRLKKEIDGTTIKNVKKLFKLQKKQNKKKNR